MKKALISLLAIVTLGLTGCKVRATGDKYDITQYETRVYCTLTNPCTHCDSWVSLSEEKLHTAKSITCENLTRDGTYTDSHYHYCVTWVIGQ